MLRAKAVKFKQGETNFRDKMLSNTDLMGKLASIPGVVKVVNAINKTPATRKLMDNLLGIHCDRQLPEYTSEKFRSHAAPNDSFSIKKGNSAPGKVVIYATCYINYNEPGIGDDLLKLLVHNEIPTRLVEKEACCGMPKLELGDLDAVKKLKEINVPYLADLARHGLRYYFYVLNVREHERQFLLIHERARRYRSQDSVALPGQIRQIGDINFFQFLYCIQIT